MTKQQKVNPRQPLLFKFRHLHFLFFCLERAVGARLARERCAGLLPALLFRLGPSGARRAMRDGSACTIALDGSSRGLCLSRRLRVPRRAEAAARRMHAQGRRTLCAPRVRALRTSRRVGQGREGCFEIPDTKAGTGSAGSRRRGAARPPDHPAPRTHVFSSSLDQMRHELEQVGWQCR